ncbi:DUF551 domain-containing protein [Klebsiella aerogenes]|uniref:DUF551 domain-containing protein n=1 Tax=Klebsiella aerogenes TaxID=548 RepID=UPI00292E8AB5|nr:DUF551 domain-containing protein [Klebsiella aerogenes]
MTKSTITRERLEHYASLPTQPFDDGASIFMYEVRMMARMALAAMDSEPVAWMSKGGAVLNGMRQNAHDFAHYNIPLYRHAQPAQTGVDDDVRSIIGLLEANEWAEHCTETVLGSCLEAEITRLVGCVQPAPVAPDAATAIRACLSEFPESVRDIVEECADIAEKACRAAMLQDEPVTTANKLGNSPAPVSSREHFISLCNEFWNWSEMDMVCADDRGYDLRMEWNGKVFSHPVTQALWRMCQAAPGNSPVIPDTWIPVSVRLPEEGGRYWCYVEEQNSLGKSHYQWNCSWNGEIWGSAMMYGRVTHWMPLPNPPKE